jgi:hypothetical protein
MEQPIGILRHQEAAVNLGGVEERAWEETDLCERERLDDWLRKAFPYRLTAIPPYRPVEKRQPSNECENRAAFHGTRVRGVRG